MKKAVNLRLEESVIYTLNELAQELNATKTEIIEQAIKKFSKDKKLKNSNLLEFAGVLKAKEAESMLQSIQESKDSKDFKLEL
ncbi:MAG: ribbon-helix-helix protein, CopG family [Campylobacterota bacterium]|nr:ribbon-helix-helix protein, CopG family [Campylobacterota bacterium]